MANKKVDIVIVEGLSDESYLYPLKLLLAKNNKDIYIHVTRGDITSNITEYHASTIKNKLHEIVEQVNHEKKFGFENIRRIVHIVDIDAIYCDNDDIIENKDSTCATFQNQKLIVKSKSSIIKRNENKKIVLSILSSLTSGITCSDCNISYEIYFFSICADHVMVDRINLTNEDKEELSMEFAEKYQDDLPGFKMILRDKSFVGASYKDSWELIKDSNVAFEAKTNVNLLLEDEDES